MDWQDIAIGLVIAIVLAAGGFAAGYHFGGLSSAKALLAYQKAEATAVASATQAAKDAQTKADAAYEAQLQQQLANEQQAVKTALADNQKRVQTINSLTARIRANESTPTVAAWTPVPIPAGALTGLCFYDTSGSAPAACGN